MITLAIVLGVPSLASLWESSNSYVYLKILDREITSMPVRVGVLIAAVAGLIWLVFALGRAYELSGVPKLLVDDELIQDQTNYRLFLESKQKDLITKVRLMNVVDANRQSLVPGRFPLELEWSHHQEESTVQLTAGIRESVSVAGLHRTTGRATLLFTGARHMGSVPLKKSEKAYFLVWVEYPKHKPIERWFCFEDMGDSFRVSVEAPAELITQPQAVLEASKRES